MKSIWLLLLIAVICNYNTVCASNHALEEDDPFVTRDDDLDDDLEEDDDDDNSITINDDIDGDAFAAGDDEALEDDIDGDAVSPAAKPVPPLEKCNVRLRE